MTRNLQSYMRPLGAFCVACWLMTACEMQGDEVKLDNSVAISLETELEEVLNIMSSDPQTAISKCDEVINKAQNAASSYYMGKAMWYKAYIYDDIVEDVSKAYFGYHDALKHLKDTDDATIIAKVSNNLAILNQYYAQYDAAASIYEEIVADADNIEEKLLSNIYYNLGRTYKLKGDKESFFKAEAAFTMALELAKRIGNDENIASVKNQVGLMYKDLGDYEMARIAYRNTVRTYQDADPSSDVFEYVGKAYHGIGVTYMEQKQHDDAIAAFEKALLFEKSSRSIFITKYDLGSVLQDAGHIEEAIAIWKDALSEKYNKNERIQVEIYAKLTSALALSQNYEEAVEYAQAYNQHISEILSVGEQYKAENDEVI
ncbi:MAG: tetratricopeptide repeat protein, partial [Bacteroidota bacterium]